jgi:hypothetical protein
MRKTVIALYEDLDSARKAIRVLVDHGFNPKRFSLLALSSNGKSMDRFGENDPTTGSGLAQGVAAGVGVEAVLGGFAGLLVGLGMLEIPGIGLVVAAGPLGAAINGLTGSDVEVAAGSLAGGLVNALADMDIQEENAYLYAEGVRRGGTLLVVRASELRSGDAFDILSRYGPIDVDERADQWRKDGLPESSPDGRVQDNGDYSWYDQAFRSHFKSISFARKYRYYLYEDCEPAYRYGYELGRSRRYGGQEWSEIEPEARKAWDDRYPGTWNRFKNCIRFAWKRSRM